MKMPSTTNPESLFRICIKYIGSNAKLIESLAGFPDILGKEIFKSAVQANQFDSLKVAISGRNCMKIFFDAYGYCNILESLSLCQAQLFLNDIVDSCWWLCENVCHLDLSFCGLGDDHDIIPLLLDGFRLETLVLKGNTVTDEGVRKLTTRLRLYQNTFSRLRCLDISENSGITVKCTSFLQCLSNLALLNLSRTATTEEEVTLSGSHFSCITQDLCACIASSFEVGTKGWAAEEIEKWKQEYVVSKPLTHSEPQPTEPSSLLYPFGTCFSVGNFYSKKRSLSIVRACPQKLETAQKKSTGCLVLISQLFMCAHIQARAANQHTNSVSGKQIFAPASKLPRVIALSNKEPFQQTKMLHQTLQMRTEKNLLTSKGLPISDNQSYDMKSSQNKVQRDVINNIRNTSSSSHYLFKKVDSLNNSEATLRKSKEVSYDDGTLAYSKCNEKCYNKSCFENCHVSQASKESFDSDMEEKSLLSLYQNSPPKKKKVKRMSLLQQLEKCVP